MEPADFAFYMENVFGPLTLFNLILSTTVILLSWKFGLYKDFPAGLFRWVMYNDWGYFFVMSPLRWLPTHPLTPITGYPGTDAGCRFSAAVDNFFQMGGLYINFLLVSCIFYMVSFNRPAITKDNQLYYAAGYFVFGSVFAISAAAGNVTNNVGLCFSDTDLVLVRAALWWLGIIFQSLLIIPIALTIWQTSRAASGKTVGFGTYFRFVTIILPQLLSRGPVHLLELHSRSRVPPSNTLQWIIIVGLPLAQMVDTIMLGGKAAQACTGSFSRVAPENKSTKKYLAMNTNDKSQEGKRRSLQGANALVPPRTPDTDTEEVKSQAPSSKSGNSTIQRKPSKAVPGSVSSWLDSILSKELSFFTKTVMAVVAVVFALSLVVAMRIDLQRDERDRVTRLRDRMSVVNTMGEFLRCSNNERMLASHFTNSNGTAYLSDYKQQQALTDTARFQLELALLQADVRTTRTINPVTVIEKGVYYMRALEVHRARVVARYIGTKEVMQYYTTMNRYFLDYMLTRVSQDVTPSTRKTLAELSYLSLSEEFQTSRALGLYVFSTQSFESSYDYWLHVRSPFASAYAQKFLLLVDPSIASSSEYTTMASSPTYQDVINMQRIASSNSTASIASVSVDTWKNSTDTMSKLVRSLGSAVSVSQDLEVGALASWYGNRFRTAAGTLMPVLALNAVALLLTTLLAITLLWATVDYDKQQMDDEDNTQSRCPIPLGIHLVLTMVLSAVAVFVLAVMILKTNAQDSLQGAQLRDVRTVDLAAMSVFEALQEERAAGSLWLAQLARGANNSSVSLSQYRSLFTSTDRQLTTLSALLDNTVPFVIDGGFRASLQALRVSVSATAITTAKLQTLLTGYRSLARSIISYMYNRTNTIEMPLVEYLMMQQGFVDEWEESEFQLLTSASITTATCAGGSACSTTIAPLQGSVSYVASHLIDAWGANKGSLVSQLGDVMSKFEVIPPKYGTSAPSLNTSLSSWRDGAMQVDIMVQGLQASIQTAIDALATSEQDDLRDISIGLSILLLGVIVIGVVLIVRVHLLSDAMVFQKTLLNLKVETEKPEAPLQPFPKGFDKFGGYLQTGRWRHRASRPA